jgi:phosphoglycerate dehydrogenase-like enzyme
MLRVAFAGIFPASLEEPVRRHLAIPCDIIVSDEAGIISQLAEIDVLVTMALTAEMGRASTRLKLVQVPGAGLDRIDRSALPNGASLANVYGHETGIAEYVIGAILALTREFSRLDVALRLGDWQSQWAIGVAPPPAWPELAGKTIGILGYGRIGQCTARRARAFDMKICAIRRDVRQSAADDLALLGGPEMMDDVLRRSDYVVVSMPATPEAIGSIDRRRLGLMKSTAFLVNVARAEIVDEDALYEALAERSIAGAALDVWYRYPRQPGPTARATQPFHELPNVLMTPTSPAGRMARGILAPS